MSIIFLVLALVFFIIAAIPLPPNRVAWLPLGLACMVAAQLTAGVALR